MISEIVDTFSTASDRAEFVDAIRRVRNSYAADSDHWQAWDLILRAAQWPPSAAVRGEEIATREVGRVVVVCPAGATYRDSPPEEYLIDRLFNAGIWHLVWDDDAEQAIKLAEEIGAVVLTVTNADISGEFVTHVREDGNRVRLERWIATVNPGRRTDDGED